MLQTIGDNVNKTFVITFSREWNKADANHMYDSDLYKNYYKTINKTALVLFFYFSSGYLIFCFVLF